MAAKTHPYRDLARRYLERFGVEVSFNPERASRGPRGMGVSMLGPRAVGKTSLLASMYDQLENVIRAADLRLSTEEAELAALLDEKVARLQALFVTHGPFAPSDEGLELNPRGGLAGTKEVAHFPFRLGRRGREGTIRLDFFDYPGAFLERQGTQFRPGWVVDLLRHSHVILIPIDAPALMEHGGVWNRMRNRPEFIDDLVSRAFIGLDSPRLVILCPIRCERYLRTATGKRDILACTKTSYARLLGNLAVGDLRDLVTVVVTPVQTLGEVVLDRIPESEYAPVFRKIHRGAQYAPVDTEQPLRYLLRFAIRVHAQEHTWWETIWHDIFGGDKYLIEASQHFAAGCHTSAPFAVLQGKAWLDPSSRRHGRT